MNKIQDAFYGLAVGDALGVPVEFLSRDTIARKPVVDMQAFGTHHQPAGTWSDDSSLAFCLAAMLCDGYDLHAIGNSFVNWYNHNFWTARGRVFDVGIATAQAIDNLKHGESPFTSGLTSERENGNGSLMRILPLVFYTKNMDIKARFQHVKEVSGLTHAHIRSVICCFIYTEFALLLLQGKEKFAAYGEMQITVNTFLKTYNLCSETELNVFHRILENPIPRSLSNHEIRKIIDCAEGEISSSGYVLHTLEASIWCFLKTNTYSEAVLKAVNLGNDTDTTGCVTGGLAGLYYGTNAIPADWLAVLARRSDIADLAGKLNEKTA
jgi:ADP-ribosyl-[dinitrogen reductase] hydrolase